MGTSFAEAVANLFNTSRPPVPVGGDGISVPFPVQIEGPGAIDVIRSPEDPSIEVPKRSDMTLEMKVLTICSLVVFFGVICVAAPATAFVLAQAHAYVMSNAS